MGTNRQSNLNSHKNVLAPTDAPSLTKIINLSPSLISVYDIKRGKYSFVSESLSALLGYKPKDFLEGGLDFANSIVHPNDRESIARENLKALKEANSKKADSKKMIARFEYRMRHKKGNWIWLYTQGSIFSRDKSGMVTEVINVSVDITQRKTEEENEKSFYQNYMKAIMLREKIASVLRKEQPFEEALGQSLHSVIKTIDALFGRLWLFDPETSELELLTSAGIYPPLKTIRPRLKLGEYAVGMVAQKKQPIVKNNIYKAKNKLAQNEEWSKEHGLKSFAGYPLLFKDRLIGVISIFATYDLSDSVLETLASVANILAQEIERRNIEAQLNDSRTRYLSFITQSSEGIWRFEVEKPVPIQLPIKKQIDQFYEYAYLAECNDALAKMYGLKKASDIIGARLGDMLIRDNPENVTYLENFIKSGYNLAGANSTEVDSLRNIRHFENSLVGIIENDMLVRVWGTQRDITEQRKAESQLRELGRQKDEFIAIASHELKTPVTTLKAYTQILEKRLAASGDLSSSAMLGKMDQQLNKLTGLITDLLDVSKIEAGKLQFQNSRFPLNLLLRETIEEMQRTTEKHHLILKEDTDCTIEGDRDRIGQVILNFISNAIKYAPDSNRVIIRSKVKNKKVTVSVRDYGIGIDESERQQIFDRFFRGSNPNMNSYPGLGLGLYICAEIVKRHNGKIGALGKKGVGSTFFFSIPVV